MLEGASFVLAGLYVVTTALRVALALGRLGTTPAPQPAAADEPITVMQPLLSGDPNLPALLAENLANQPEAHFLWLIDEDDAEARRLAAKLATPRVEVLLAPAVPQGKNPKVFKLALGLPRCGPWVAVLDDDTVLPPGALARAREALATGELVTGLPVYRPGNTVWSRLVAAFVNGSALVTYLPMLHFGPPVTINGMFYLTRRATLESLGGFAPIVDRLCDDYELAKLYRRAGLRIVQTTIAHPLATTVPDFATYARLLRRWMVFARQLFRESLTVPMIGLVVVPAFLPLGALGLAAAAGSRPAVAVAIAALGAKAAVLALLRRRYFGTREGLDTFGCEVLADLVQPFHALAAAVRPSRIRWRSRRIEIAAGGVRYR